VTILNLQNEDIQLHSFEHKIFHLFLKITRYFAGIRNSVTYFQHSHSRTAVQGCCTTRIKSSVYHAWATI